MNQPMQSLAMANLIVASRLPSEGNFRRDAILGAMVSLVNPLAGVVVAARSADALTALVRERDSLAAQQAAQPAGTPPKTEGGKPASIAGEADTAFLEATQKYVADATRFTDALKDKEAAHKFAEKVALLIKELKAALDEGGAPSEQTDEKLAREQMRAITEISAAFTKMAAAAEEAVANQEEHHATLQQLLELKQSQNNTASTASSGASQSAGSSKDKQAAAPT